MKAGAIGSQVDEVARTVIRDAGYGDSFGHGLGHGVGLEIHRRPARSEQQGTAAGGRDRHGRTGDRPSLARPVWDQESGRGRG